jgi:hypothetical protein
VGRPPRRDRQSSTAPRVANEQAGRRIRSARALGSKEKFTERANEVPLQVHKARRVSEWRLPCAHGSKSSKRWQLAAQVVPIDEAPRRENTAFSYSFGTAPSPCAYPPDHGYLQEAFDADKLQFFSSHQARQEFKSMTHGMQRDRFRNFGKAAGFKAHLHLRNRDRSCFRAVTTGL